MKKRPETIASAAPDEAQRLEAVLAALRGAGEGDFSVRLAHEGAGIMSDIALAFNRLMELRAMTGIQPPEETRLTTETPSIESLQTALRQVKHGDFSVRLPANLKGVVGDTYRDFNDVVTLSERMAGEIGRIGRVVGQEGRLTERASLGAVSGVWETSIDSLNALVGDLVQPSTEVARVITAVAGGDLTQKMSLEINGRPIKG